MNVIRLTVPLVKTGFPRIRQNLSILNPLLIAGLQNPQGINTYPHHVINGTIERQPHAKTGKLSTTRPRV
jgi:hypothetical protein